MTGWERLKNLWKISNIPAEDILILPERREPTPAPDEQEEKPPEEPPRKPATIVDLQDNVSTDFPNEDV